MKTLLKCLPAVIFTAFLTSGFSQEACCKNDTRNVYVFGSLVYLKSTMEELDFAMKRFNEVTIAPLNLNSVGNTVDLNYNWKPGVRAGIGYHSDCTGWKAELTGMHYNYNAGNNVAVSSIDVSVEQLSPLWFPGLMGFTCQDASAYWQLDFNTVDLDFGKTFYSGRCFSWTPFAGLRFAHINQRYTAEYNNCVYLVLDGGGTVFFTKDNDTVLNSDFDALGFKAGSDFLYQARPNLAFKGSVTGSFVYGKQKNKIYVNGGFPSTFTGALALTPINFTTRNNPYKIIYSVESEFGAKWTVCKFRNSAFSIAANYLYAVWFNMNPFTNYFFSTDPTGLVGAVTNSNSLVSNKLDGHLQMHGVTLDASLNF